VIRYLLSATRSRNLICNLFFGLFFAFAAPGYASENSEFSAVIKIARDEGSDVQSISTNCTVQSKRLLGYLKGNILCLNTATLVQKGVAVDGVTIAALAMSLALAEADNRRKLKLTLGSLLEGMVAAAVESDIQGRESARPERQARHDRPYALDRDRPYSTDRVPERVQMDFWVKRGLSWAKRAGACESGAIQMLERIKRSELADPQNRSDAKALLGALGFLRYHPEPCV
jgi:hypothetical protein